MQTVPQDQAIVNPSDQIDAANEQGRDVIVVRSDIAFDGIIPLPQPDVASEPALPRQPGTARGLIHMRENFEDPLEDFANYQ